MTDVVGMLIEARKQQHLSLHALAAKFGTSASSIHEWENRVHVPTLTSLRAWAAALGYDVTLERGAGDGPA